jgi:putative ABC transport system permease protein
VAIAERPAPVTVTALVSDPRDLDRQLFALAPARAGDAASARDLGPPAWLVGLPRPDARLPEAPGRVFTPRAPLGFQQGGGLAADLGLLVGLGSLLETMLLAGAALAVVMGGQRRDLALLGALGMPATLRRRFLRIHASIIGLAGALVGAAAGMAAARSLAPVLAARDRADWGPFDPALFAVGLLAVAAVAATILVAELVSRRIARQEPAALLRPPEPRRQAPATTVTAAALGSFALMLTVSALLSGSGGSLTVVAILAALVGGVTATVLQGSRLALRLGARPHLGLPSPLRLAARALGAHPGRTAASVVALAFVSALATMALVTTASVVHKRQDEYLPSVPDGVALLSTPRALAAAELLSFAGAGATAARAAELRDALVVGEEGERPVSPLTDLLTCVEQRGLMKLGRNVWQPCHLQASAQVPFGAVAVAPARELERLLGAPLSAPQAARYEQGILVVALTTVVLDPGAPGAVTFIRPTPTTTGFRFARVGTVSALVTGEGGPEHRAFPDVLIAPAAAARMGIVSSSRRMYVVGAIPGRPPSRPALPADVRAESTIVTEGGPPPPGTLAQLGGAIALAAMVTTVTLVAALLGLWSAELREHHLMLAALGASRRQRRRFAAAVGLLLAVPAALVGGGWGLSSVLALLRSLATPATFPLPWLVVLAAVTVAASAGASALFVPAGARALRRA